ncbi:hypothetical protein JQM84_12020 [Parabacteroides distasonis]|nr:hypothetical protein [Parabacteroides distasonis]
MVKNIRNIHSILQYMLLLAMLGLNVPLSAYAKKQMKPEGYLLITNYAQPGSDRDLADAIQRAIDENPGRTLFFPDGVYLLSHPIKTPADPLRSVSLVLSNYACLKATKDWEHGNALVQLGTIHPANDITIPGSNYGLTGGIIDGSNVADGVSIDGGRETYIREVSIKHTRIGVHIKYGANNGSSDADIRDVNIVGNNCSNAIGVLVEGYDNTLTNMRIASVNKGVWLKAAGNSLRNIHPLYIFGQEQDYESSCGFVLEDGNNWLHFCYSDQMATGFLLKSSSTAQLTDCFCFWYTGIGAFQTAIHVKDGPLQSYFKGLNVGFHSEGKNFSLIKALRGGMGYISALIGYLPILTPEDESASYVKP